MRNTKLKKKPTPTVFARQNERAEKQCSNDCPRYKDTNYGGALNSKKSGEEPMHSPLYSRLRFSQQFPNSLLVNAESEYIFVATLPPHI